jgi:glycosyltransferase
MNGTDIKVNLIEMNASVERLTVEIPNDVRYISIPRPMNIPRDIDFREYLEIVQNYTVHLLKEYVSEQDDNIFHLNRMGALSFAKKLKEHFINGKIVLTMHYTNWSLSLLGDKSHLKKIMRSERELLLPMEMEVYDEVIERRELISNYCDKVIAISEHSYRNLVSVYKVPKTKVILINNALQDQGRSIAADKNKTREKFHIPAHEAVLIYAGRVDRIKGVFILTEAFNRILKKHPECRLIIAGSGQVEAVMALAGCNNSKITYMGFIPKRTLYKLYSISDIGFIPSIYEEFGYVALEMMMHKLPVVVSDTTGLREIIDNGSDVLRVPIKKESGRFHQSAKNLAEKISILIDRYDLQQQYGEAARKKYLYKYGLSLFRRRMLQLYDSLI